MRRGVTLLELVLALSLLLALSAIALPAMLEASDAKKLGTAAEAVEEQLLLARAYAMVEGMSVEVRFDASTHQMLVRETGADEDADSKDGAHGFAQDDQVPHEPTTLARSWAKLSIDEAVNVSNEKPAIEALSEGATSETLPLPHAPDAMDGAADREGPAELLVLAVYLPDGSAPITQPIWLWQDAGRAMRIDIGAWTGIPVIDREPVLTNEEPVTDENSDESAEPERATDETSNSHDGAAPATDAVSANQPDHERPDSGDPDEDKSP